MFFLPPFAKSRLCLLRIYFEDEVTSFDCISIFWFDEKQTLGGKCFFPLAQKKQLSMRKMDIEPSTTAEGKFGRWSEKKIDLLQ